jgi:hypothetical protein
VQVRLLSETSMRTLISLTIAATSLLPLKASNIVLNGGFETGDFSSWTVTNAAASTHLFVTSNTGNTGVHAAAFEATREGLYDSIAQTLTTINGESYTFTFFLVGNFGNFRSEPDSAFDPDADFQVSWDGNLVLDSHAANNTSFDFTQFSFSEVATGNDTITFSGYNIPGAYFLDDVAVSSASSVPEPATWMLLIGPLLTVSIFRIVRWGLRRGEGR